MKALIDPSLTGKDLINYLVANKKQLMAQKKAIIKEADGFAFNNQVYIGKADTAIKADAQPVTNTDADLRVVPVINTTFWHDSHDDVHIDGLWDKSLQENKYVMHIQEHKMMFDKIISDGADLTAYAQKIPWRQLGVDVAGNTEALMFNSTVKKSRNAYMHEQYRLGYVKNHSVGMRYVNLELAVNDEDWKEEFAVWNKYINRIANKEHSLSIGYFWAVKEAKVIEGSAVPMGSNVITPTYEVSQKSTGDQPPHGTDGQPQFDIEKAIKQSIFII